MRNVIRLEVGKVMDSRGKGVIRVRFSGCVLRRRGRLGEEALRSRSDKSCRSSTWRRISISLGTGCDEDLHWKRNRIYMPEAAPPRVRLGWQISPFPQNERDLQICTWRNITPHWLTGVDDPLNRPRSVNLQIAGCTPLLKSLWVGRSRSP